MNDQRKLFIFQEYETSWKKNELNYTSDIPRRPCLGNTWAHKRSHYKWSMCTVVSLLCLQWMVRRNVWKNNIVSLNFIDHWMFLLLIFTHYIKIYTSFMDVHCILQGYICTCFTITMRNRITFCVSINKSDTIYLVYILRNLLYWMGNFEALTSQHEKLVLFPVSCSI